MATGCRPDADAPNGLVREHWCLFMMWQMLVAAHLVWYSTPSNTCQSWHMLGLRHIPK